MDKRRQLNEDEKKFSKISLRKLEQEAKIQDFTVRVIEGELEMIPLKLTIAEYVKKEELKKSRRELIFTNKRIAILLEQLNKGVLPKEPLEEVNEK